MSWIWHIESDLYELWHRVSGKSRLDLQRVLIGLGAALMVLCDVILPLVGVRRVEANWLPSLAVLPAVLGCCLWLLKAPMQVYSVVTPLILRVAVLVAVAGFWLVPVDILYDALITGYLEHTYLGLFGFSMIALAYLVGLRHYVELARAQP